MQAEGNASSAKPHNVDAVRVDATRSGAMPGTRPRTPTMHNLAIATLARRDPVLRTKDFAAAIRLLISDHAALEADDDRRAITEELTTLWRRSGIRPDAYKITVAEDRPTVTIYEVEDSSELTVSKMRAICDLWWFMDALCGALRLFVFDRYGQNRREIDVREWERVYWRASGVAT